MKEAGALIGLPRELRKRDSIGADITRLLKNASRDETKMPRTRLISLIAPPSIAPLMRARLGARRGGELRPHAVLAPLILL
jgi:hypothetical protein